MKLTIFFLFLVIAALGVAGCARSSAAPARLDTGANGASGIVNGKNATAADIAPNGVADAVVLIIVNDVSHSYWCSGTLIDPQVVLTAGHCIMGSKTSNISVIFHALDAADVGPDGYLPQGASVYSVRSSLVNANYSKSNGEKSNEDLAVLLLDRGVPSQTKIAQLPNAQMDYTTISGLTVIGYGAANDHHDVSAGDNGVGVLRTTQFSRDQISATPASSTTDPNIAGMIMTQDANTSICGGDSGGPMMAIVKGRTTDVIVGVNQAALPKYTGEQQKDFEAAIKLRNYAAFFAKYPDAQTCSGGNDFAVNTLQELSWIQGAKSALLDKGITKSAAISENP